MTRTQEKKTQPSNQLFERLRRYQVTEGLTWKQVAERLGISVSTIMAVKGETRSLGPKALYRLEEAERKAAARKSAAEQVVDELLSGEGSAREVVQKITSRKSGQELPVDYVDSRRAQALPEAIKLVRPSEEGCRRLRKLFAETLDSRIVLLACLPPDRRTEAFLGLLTQATVSRLQSASLELVFGVEWRARLAELALIEKSVAPGK